jgi:hypothetical protein
MSEEEEKTEHNWCKDYTVQGLLKSLTFSKVDKMVYKSSN